MEQPKWKKNQFAYINKYNRSHYHRLTVQLSMTGEDAEIWEAIKNSKSKNEALKALARKGLKAS